MKILILGASGMLGHQLWLKLSESFEVYGTIRNSFPNLEELQNYNRKLIKDLDVTNSNKVEELLSSEEYDIIINCIGVIKQKESSKIYPYTILLNSLLPHQLSNWSKRAKIIQISTDCVFSGRTGNYSEFDIPDAEDLYGRSKLLGEIKYEPHLTLRTSIIGHEINSSVSLIDWFLSQKDHVNGYKNAIYSGLTTLELAKQIESLLLNYIELTGLYQIASEPINKYDLLKLVSNVYSHKIKIKEFYEYKTDKSLNYNLLSQEIGYKPTAWETQIRELNNHYNTFKKQLYSK